MHFYLKHFFIGAILFFVTTNVWAHPVSYQGAWSLMSNSSAEKNDVMLTYSWKWNFAPALTYMREGRGYYSIPRLNFLLKRWNNEDSQANIYLSGGYGIERFEGEQAGVALGDFEADWESRKYYTSFKWTHYDRPSTETFIRKNRDDYRYRLGFAPYLGEFKDLNTWFILQFEKNGPQNIETYQVLRFYIHNVLWEAGASFNGNWLFNFMIHI